MNRNITATILIVLAIGVYFTVTSSVLDAAKAVKIVNDQYSSALGSASQLIAGRDKIQNDYNKISQMDRDRLGKMIPSVVDNIRLTIDMNQIAARHGLVLNGIGASLSSPAKGSQTSNSQSSSGLPVLDTVNISFSVSADFQQFMNFIQDLEANLRIMDITHFNMTVGDNGMYTFAVSLKTYWARQ